MHGNNRGTLARARIIITEGLLHIFQYWNFQQLFPANSEDCHKMIDNNNIDNASYKSKVHKIITLIIILLCFRPLSEWNIDYHRIQRRNFDSPPSLESQHTWNSSLELYQMFHFSKHWLKKRTMRTLVVFLCNAKNFCVLAN